MSVRSADFETNGSGRVSSFHSFTYEYYVPYLRDIPTGEIE